MTFDSLTLARRWIRRIGSPSMVVLVAGDGKYLVCGPAEAAQLIRQGYELAEDPELKMLPFDGDKVLLEVANE